jgi:hypothetical protein
VNNGFPDDLPSALFFGQCFRCLNMIGEPKTSKRFWALRVLSIMRRHSQHGLQDALGWCTSQLPTFSGGQGVNGQSNAPAGKEWSILGGRDRRER